MLFKRFTAPDLQETWGFPTIRGTVLGVSIIRIIIFLGLYILGSPYLGKPPFLQKIQNA